MFFIMGINPGKKKIEYYDTVVCNICGQYGRYEVYMAYTCLSLFFIPLLKWGRRFMVEMSCCHSLYELNEEVGRALLRGEQRTIQKSDLTLFKWAGPTAFGGESRDPSDSKRCSICGYEAKEEFNYCPRCGSRNWK